MLNFTSYSLILFYLLSVPIALHPLLVFFGAVFSRRVLGVAVMLRHMRIYAPFKVPFRRCQIALSVLNVVKL